MVARVRTVAFQGIDVLGVDAEVQITQGLPAFNLVEPFATAIVRSQRGPRRGGSCARPSIDGSPHSAMACARFNCDQVLP